MRYLLKKQIRQRNIINPVDTKFANDHKKKSVVISTLSFTMKLSHPQIRHQLLLTLSASSMRMRRHLAGEKEAPSG